MTKIKVDVYGREAGLALYKIFEEPEYLEENDLELELEEINAEIEEIKQICSRYDCWLAILEDGEVIFEKKGKNTSDFSLIVTIKLENENKSIGYRFNLYSDGRVGVGRSQIGGSDETEVIFSKHKVLQILQNLLEPEDESEGPFFVSSGDLEEFKEKLEKFGLPRY